jgi:hypothetical protein
MRNISGLRRIFQLLGIAALSVGAAGCIERKAVSPENVSEPAQLEVELLDGTRYGLERGHGDDGRLCGKPRHCTGASCAKVKADGCVENETIVALHEQKVNGTAVAIGVGISAAAAIALTVVAVSASNSSSSRNQSTASSSSSGTSSRGSAGIGSCPRVYSWNGTSWRLDSGTFGVSYFEAAPRTDFDVLDHVAVDQGRYRLRLVNEQDETEHTDLVRLRVIDHPEGTRIVPTAAGKLLTFRDELSPVSAQDFRGKDALSQVTTKDDREWSSDLRGRHVTHGDDARDGLRLVFTKPPNAKLVKVRVAAHNTDWAGQMLGYLLAHRGPTLPAWFAKMNTDATARAELTAFLLREGMLNIRVKTPSGWSTRGVFWAAGSEIVKEEAFEIPVADVPGDKLEIELESALDFWSVDAASIAYGANERIVVRDLSPSSARTNDGRDVSATFARVDSVRFDTVRGDVAELAFDAPASAPAGSLRSFVLETNGYYVPEIAPAADADPGAIDALMADPFAASRLALAFRLATLR